MFLRGTPGIQQLLTDVAHFYIKLNLRVIRIVIFTQATNIFMVTLKQNLMDHGYETSIFTLKSKTLPQLLPVTYLWEQFQSK